MQDELSAQSIEALKTASYFVLSLSSNPNYLMSLRHSTQATFAVLRSGFDHCTQLRIVVLDMPDLSQSHGLHVELQVKQHALCG